MGAFLIWRDRIEERVRLLEKQLQELRGTLMQFTPVKKRRDDRSYLSLLNRHLSDDDVRELAFMFGVDYESLSGDSHRGRLLSLVLDMERAGRLYQLEQAVRQMRPGVDWPVFV